MLLLQLVVERLLLCLMLQLLLPPWPYLLLHASWALQQLLCLQQHLQQCFLLHLQHREAFQAQQRLKLLLVLECCLQLLLVLHLLYASCRSLLLLLVHLKLLQESCLLPQQQLLLCEGDQAWRLAVMVLLLMSCQDL